MKNKKVLVIGIAVIMVMGLIGAVIEKTSPATTPSVAKQEQYSHLRGVTQLFPKIYPDTITILQNPNTWN